MPVTPRSMFDTTITSYAPAMRCSLAEIYQDFRNLRDSASMQHILDSIPTLILVLNLHRQVVYLNRALCTFLNLKGKEEALGLRPGELLGCIHSLVPGGCGTSKFCKTCGAVNAILTSQQGKESVQECRISTNNESFLRALDLRVWAQPMQLQQNLYTIFTLVDIADEKRRAVLERLFYHDIYNTIGGFKGALELLRPFATDTTQEILSSMEQQANRLNDEMESHRILSAAENNDLPVNSTLIQSLPLLEKVAQSYFTHSVAKERHIRISPNAENARFYSDLILLQRVIGNMVKNALEAIQPDETVTLGCQSSETSVKFWVHNPGTVPQNVQLQLFQRSFSTKDPRRGLGTYSMKLLSEQYLKGHISFTSSDEKGTMFVGTFPWGLNSRSN